MQIGNSVTTSTNLKQADIVVLKMLVIKRILTVSIYIVLVHKQLLLSTYGWTIYARELRDPQHEEMVYKILNLYERFRDSLNLDFLRFPNFCNMQNTMKFWMKIQRFSQFMLHCWPLKGTSRPLLWSVTWQVTTPSYPMKYHTTRDFMGNMPNNGVTFHDDASSLQIASLLFTLKNFIYFWHLNTFVYVMTTNDACPAITPKPL